MKGNDTPFIWCSEVTTYQYRFNVNLAFIQIFPNMCLPIRVADVENQLCLLASNNVKASFQITRILRFFIFRFSLSARSSIILRSLSCRSIRCIFIRCILHSLFVHARSNCQTLLCFLRHLKRNRRSCFAIGADQISISTRF